MIELAFKVCIAQKMRKNVIPVRQFINSVYTHDPDTLLGVAELREQLKLASASDIDLDVNWRIVLAWNEESRYRRWNRAEATSLYEAVTDPDHGVLRWIMQYW